MKNVFKGFTLMNPEKLDRAVNGAIASSGVRKGGVGTKENFEKDPANKGKDWEAQVLAKYDSLGGYITKDGNKVKMGSFFDFEKKRNKEKSEVVFVFRDLEGRVVELDEGKDVPLDVQAATKARKVKKVAKKVKK